MTEFDDKLQELLAQLPEEPVNERDWMRHAARKMALSNAKLRGQLADVKRELAETRMHLHDLSKAAPEPQCCDCADALENAYQGIKVRDQEHAQTKADFARLEKRNDLMATDLESTERLSEFRRGVIDRLTRKLNDWAEDMHSLRSELRGARTRIEVLEYAARTVDHVAAEATPRAGTAMHDIDPNDIPF